LKNIRVSHCAKQKKNTKSPKKRQKAKGKRQKAKDKKLKIPNTKYQIANKFQILNNKRPESRNQSQGASNPISPLRSGPNDREGAIAIGKTSLNQ